MPAEAVAGAPPATFHRPGGAWLSGHLFLRGRGHTDEVLARVVHPFAARCLERGLAGGFFFIRYSELGPHLRLRFYGDPAVLEAEVAPGLEEQLRGTLPAAAAGEPVQEPAAVTRGSGHPSLRWIAYEPEVDRYGGPHALPVAEELFHCSSQVSIALLGRSPLTDRAVRLGRVLPTLVTLLAAFTGDPAEAAALARLHRD
ncbi:MAG TPA: thiopeptide-type bacteriocin biosynthesis protein, partial [Longimicrobium sp.]